MYFKILSLALAVITFSGVAIADTVTSPGRSSTTATKSTYDWTGVYAGVNLGAVWSGSHLNANQANLASSTGSYSQNMNSTAVNPGFQFGYLHQLKDNWVVGGEADFKVIEKIGTPRDFKKEGFEAKDHVELGKILGAIDVERGAKVSGSRFYYLTGVGAMLEFALVNYAIASANKNGFIPVIPPVLVKPAAMEGTGFLGQAAENVFHLKEDDFYLVGTSEVPLAAYHMDEVLDANKLPLRYSGYSSCFRREAGTYGKDTRGIIRVHQFDKVEMFSFCKPEDAEAEHLRILQWEKDFLNAMEIPFRVIDVASGDLGSSAARKFDCEAWIPTQGTYREVTSTSNCTEFQARRLNIRMKDNDGTKPIATLNGTLVAIPRMIVAILENHQQSDGSVRIPKVLQPFLGTELFTPVKN